MNNTNIKILKKLKPKKKLINYYYCTPDKKLKLFNPIDIYLKMADKTNETNPTLLDMELTGIDPKTLKSLFDNVAEMNQTLKKILNNQLNVDEDMKNYFKNNTNLKKKRKIDNEDSDVTLIEDSDEEKDEKNNKKPIKKLEKLFNINKGDNINLKYFTKKNGTYKVKTKKGKCKIDFNETILKKIKDQKFDLIESNGYFKLEFNLGKFAFDIINNDSDTE